MAPNSLLACGFSVLPGETSIERFVEQHFADVVEVRDDAKYDHHYSTWHPVRDYELTQNGCEILIPSCHTLARESAQGPLVDDFYFESHGRTVRATLESQKTYESGCVRVRLLFELPY